MSTLRAGSRCFLSGLASGRARVISKKSKYLRHLNRRPDSSRGSSWQLNPFHNPQEAAGLGDHQGSKVHMGRASVCVGGSIHKVKSAQTSLPAFILNPKNHRARPKENMPISG